MPICGVFAVGSLRGKFTNSQKSPPNLVTKNSLTFCIKLPKFSPQCGICLFLPQLHPLKNQYCGGSFSLEASIALLRVYLKNRVNLNQYKNC